MVVAQPRGGNGTGYFGYLPRPALNAEGLGNF